MKVYLTEYIHEDALKLLSSKCEITDIIEECDAVLTRNLIIDKEWIDRAKNLRVIGIHGTGTDGVDIDYAASKGIKVFNVPYQNALSVAEENVLLMLNIARHTNKIDIDNPDMNILKGNEITGKTVGFIGYGHIASMTASILANGFNMKVLAYNRSPINDKLVEEASMENVLANSDYVVLGLALNKDTKHIINYEKLAMMKNSAYLINTARGALVNEEDLARALENKVVAGYAADVFELDPIRSDNPLLKYNVIAYPHIGANTDEALYRVGYNCCKGIIERLYEE